MKKAYSFLPAFIFVVALSLLLGFKCRRYYNELGPNSVFFKFNGKPVVPSDAGILSDSLTKVYVIAEDSIHLYYYLTNYHGAGIYTFRAGDTVSHVACDYYGMYYENFYTIPQGDTYINVLEHDTVSGLFHAVFEAHLSDINGNTVQITEGRIFINVPNDY